MNKRTEAQMERARAARLILNSSDREDQKEWEVAAFMAIFHPNRQLGPKERYTDKPKRKDRQ